MDKRRINARAIVWRDGKILAVKHKVGEGEAHFWCLPGGGLDPHEALVDGARREMLEETGVDVKVGKLLFIQQFASSREGYEEELELLFLVEDSAAFDSIDLTKASHGADEIAKIAFIDPKAVSILPKFLKQIDVASYINSDKPIYIYNGFNQTD